MCIRQQIKIKLFFIHHEIKLEIYMYDKELKISNRIIQRVFIPSEIKALAKQHFIKGHTSKYHLTNN
jgi:hypothetical protein